MFTWSQMLCFKHSTCILLYNFSNPLMCVFLLKQWDIWRFQEVILFALGERMVNHRIMILTQASNSKKHLRSLLWYFSPSLLPGIESFLYNRFVRIKYTCISASFYLFYWWNILRIPTIAHKSILPCFFSRKVS